MNLKNNILKTAFTLTIALFISSQLLAQAQFKVLLITETAGWHHESIDYGIAAINELANKHTFEVDRQQKAQKITEKKLSNYDAVIFLSTTADIFDNEEQAAFEKFIQSGKGYVGIHAASDTEYDWEWYTKLVGRMFKIHPVQQTAKLRLQNSNFPGLEHFPNTLLWTDEWYEFGEEKVDDLNYLITVDENTFDANVQWGDNIGKGMGDFHPIAWYHNFDGGRSFYTALGHKEAVYSDAYFLAHLYGGIYWAATGKGIE
ncbi:ThuA domain-containing protein [Urechidicola croceus]|uniref:Crp/Fnr family transcriptional regulator n=1 Tax=Urechidicola croceus TaxID=1850246 RepID=A0A1D8PBF7_9FLAO|nr:ThuA domain-containing protein [Urechidicola croceus]AOW21908.1 Crp/Fnr family transcriptional regulator [Urechidicola croceus]